MESRSLLDDFRSFDKGAFLNLGHPLLNRIAESFVTAAGIGAVQAVSREAYLTAVEGSGSGFHSNAGQDVAVSGKKHQFSGLKGETSRKSLEAMVKNISKESVQWADYPDWSKISQLGRTLTWTGCVSFQASFIHAKGSGIVDLSIWQFNSCSLILGVVSGTGLAAGLYSGLTYGLKEARGANDWKNSMVAGAVTGAALALTCDEASHDQVLQCAITGAALSTAANLLSGIF